MKLASHIDVSCPSLVSPASFFICRHSDLFIKNGIISNIEFMSNHTLLHGRKNQDGSTDRETHIAM